jgi:hypothetical protein
MRLSRPNPARGLALVATCPTCHKDRRVTSVYGGNIDGIKGRYAVLAVCGHVVPRSDAR